MVGERWTLLIIRELLLRPRRYHKLLDAPGLARFGLLVGAGRPRAANATSRPAWAAATIEAMIDTGQVPEIDETYQFDVDGDVVHVVAAGGDALVRPDLVTTTDAQAFFGIGMRRLDPVVALVSGAVRVTGTSAAVPRCLRLIGLAAAETPPGSSVPTRSHR